MNKKTLKLISELNSLYDKFWSLWTQTEKDSFEFQEYSKKFKLIRTVSKNIEEQSRGFLRSKIDYVSGGKYILDNSSLKYEILHKGLSEVLLRV